MKTARTSPTASALAPKSRARWRDQSTSYARPAAPETKKHAARSAVMGRVSTPASVRSCRPSRNRGNGRALAGETGPRFPLTPSGLLPLLPRLHHLLDLPALLGREVLHRLPHLLLLLGRRHDARRAHHPLLLLVPGGDLEHRGRNGLLLGLSELHRVLDGARLPVLHDHLRDEAVGV